MKKNPFIRFLLTFLLFSTASFSTSILAQGAAFTYQGRLNDGGLPANGSYDFRFRLDGDPAGNTILATVFTNGVPVANGLFTMTLDFGAGRFNGSNYWLEVDVKTNKAANYTALAPFQAVTPAPYAMFANTASNLSGTLPAAQINGTISSANISGTYGGAVTLNNVANSFNGSFAGDGANVTNVNAATLNGFSATNFWQLGGTHVAAGQFIGSTNNQPVEVRVNGQRALRLEAGSNAAPNVVGGSPVNYVTNGVIGATISGGGATNYFGFYYTNSILGNFGTVSGGGGNTAVGLFATIGGGLANQALAYSVVAGGYANNAGASWTSVGGGNHNGVFGNYGTIPGGCYNYAVGNYSFAAGNEAYAMHDGAFVWADSQNAQFYSATNDSFNVRARGGVRFETSGAGVTIDGLPILASGASSGITIQNNTNGAPNIVEGSQNNSISGGIVGATISGGGATNYGGLLYYSNSVTADFGTVSGGAANTANGLNATVGGGLGNTTSTEGATVSGGEFNSAALWATVGGGYRNAASAEGATVGGGEENHATATDSVVGGGYKNTAAGFGSFAAGQQASALHAGAFVWADSQASVFSSTANDQFLIRAQGGVGINTNQPGATLDVAGSFRVNGGTVFSRLQAGQATMAGGASTSKTNLTIAFPKAFTATPKIVATVNADPGWNVDDTFVVSVRNVSTTGCEFNIVRVDAATGWSQSLRVNWIAWQ